ncbi:MAG: GAF domain-containing protein [Anaerolineales bacterium]|nr:GAF domain-containing protein [Anaerolineales bacterium]
MAPDWSILDQLHEGVIIASRDGVIHHANSAARARLGMKATAVAPSTLADVPALRSHWQLLLTAPTDLVLQTPQGQRELRVRPWRTAQQTLLQILIADQPEPDAASRSVRQLATLTQISQEPDFDRKLQLIVEALQLTGWQRVVLTLRDADFQPTRLITAGFNAAEIAHLRERLLPVSAWQDLFARGETQFRRGGCYFVPGDTDWSRRFFGHRLMGEEVPPRDAAAWHPRDVLAVPLMDSQQNKIGLLTLDQPQNGRRPDTPTLQMIELYAQYAASALENALLVQETLDRSRELEVLFEASNELANTLEKEVLLATIGKHLRKTVQAEGYAFYQWQEDSQRLVLLEAATAVALPSPTPAPIIALESMRPTLQQVLTAHEMHMRIVFPADQPTLQRPAWLPADEPYLCILLPVVLSQGTFGLIELIKQTDALPGAQDQRLLTALVKQAEIALETTLIFEETFERERFYNALGNVSLAINFTLDLDTVLSLICVESLRIFNVDGAYIWLRQDNRLVGTVAKGHAEDAFAGTAIRLDETDAFAVHVATTRQATFVNEASKAGHVRFKLPQAELIQAALGVPLEQEGHIVGVLVFIDKSNPYRFSHQDVAKATTFGVQAAIALQNSKLFAELRRLNEELDTRVARRTEALNEESTRVKILLRITSELSASLDQDRVLNQALQLVNEVVNATQGVILLIDQETGELVFRAAFGLERKPGLRGLPSGLMHDEGLAGWIISNRSAVIVHDTREDPRWVERPSSREHRSVLAVPLKTGEEVIGVLMLFHKQPNAFTMQQLDLVEAAAIQVANAINNANLYLLIRDQAERLGHTLHLEQIETAKNQAILESIADGVIVANENNRIILANVPASSLLGLPREMLIGKSINEFLGLYGQSRHSWLSVIEQWAQHADRIEQWTYIAEELPIEDKVVSVHLSPVLAGKQFFGTVSIFRDITKEVELDRLKSEFVSTVSHELRTPMTSIKGYVDLLLMGAAGKMSDAQTRYLKVIKNNAERLHMLVNDLLDISKIETGKTALDLRPIDVKQLIEQVVEGHLRGRIQHEKKAIAVKVDTPANLPLVTIDHARITQVLTNLLDNAFNYTPAQGEINISARANGGYVYVSVSDTGIGISAEDQVRIFDRFYRAEDEIVQKVPGTGLGLAIVRSLVEMHNGRLTLNSAPGQGSTFTFNLPVVVEDNEPA